MTLAMAKYRYPHTTLNPRTGIYFYSDRLFANHFYAPSI